MKDCFVSLKYICTGDKLGYKYNRYSAIFLAQKSKQNFILIFPLQTETNYLLAWAERIHLEFNCNNSYGIERTEWYEEIYKINSNKKVQYVEIDYNNYIGFLYKASPEELLEIGIKII